MTTNAVRVVTEQIPGPRGTPGATGATGIQGGPGVDAIVKPVTTASTLSHAAQPDPGVPGSVKAAANFKTSRFAGLFTATKIAGQTQAIQHAGPVYPADYSLGVGLACAVGCDVNGAPVRVTDPACVSGLNFIGWCDTAGTIFVAPRQEVVFNVRDFGAVGDGHIPNTGPDVGKVIGTDDTAAIQACITAAKAFSTANVTLGNAQPTIYFPHGVYLYSETIDFSTISYYSQYYPGITIRGDGGALGMEEPASSAIVYTGSTGNAIAARSTVGFTIRDIGILYNDRTYAGTLIDFGHGVTNNDTQTATIADCTIGFAYKPASGLGRAAKLISFDRALFSVVTNCYLRDGRIGIHGTTDGYSNQVTIQTCTFSAFSFAAIANAGNAWSILGCAFEGPFLPRLYGDDRTGAHISCLAIEACWMGDCGNWSPWIDCGNSEFHSMSIRGNLFSASIANPAATFTGTVTFAADGNTITLAAGNWSDHGFQANVEFDVTGTVSNNGRYMVSLPPVGGVMQCLQATFVDETVSCTLANAYPVGSTKDSIKLGGSKGVDITANNINTVDFTQGYGPSNAAGIHIHGNELQAEDTGVVVDPFTEAGAPLFRALYLQNTHTFSDVVLEGNTSKYQNTPGQQWFSGHLITAPGKSVKPTATSAAGSTVAMGGDPYTGSNDIAGRITLTVSSPTASGEQVRVTFSAAYNYFNGPDPYVQITPGNAATAVLPGIWASAEGTAGAYFVISSTAGLAAGTYVWQYLVTQ